MTLAVKLRRAAFDALLALAVPSSYDARLYETEAAWKTAVAASDVRLQWDPDHDPAGKPLARPARDQCRRAAGAPHRPPVRDCDPYRPLNCKVVAPPLAFGARLTPVRAAYRINEEVTNGLPEGQEDAPAIW